MREKKPVVNPSPFLRWAGGKKWFIKYLRKIMGDIEYRCYHEPFLGGGSVFFSVQPKCAVLSDLNEDLIETYQRVQSNCEQVISCLKTYQFDEDSYYRVRSIIPDDAIERAARFIYLNKTSFNGLYRVNSHGEYNVPYGHNSQVKIDYETLRAASFALRDAEIKACDFSQTLENVQQGDFVFLDPPYTVSHNGPGFIQYNKKLFDVASQRALKVYIDNIVQRGAFFILTNADSPIIRNIFHDICSDDPFEVKRFSGLGGKNAQRGNRIELVYTNIELMGGLADE